MAFRLVPSLLDEGINKTFTGSRCLICSCPVHVISTCTTCTSDHRLITHNLFSIKMKILVTLSLLTTVSGVSPEKTWGVSINLIFTSGSGSDSFTFPEIVSIELPREGEGALKLALATRICRTGVERRTSCDVPCEVITAAKSGRVDEKWFVCYYKGFIKFSLRHQLTSLCRIRTKPRYSPSAKQCKNPCSGPPTK